RLAASGREICGAGGLMDWNPDFRKIGMEGLVLLINGPDEARRAVRKLVKDGVEWVKTYPTGDAAAPDTNDHHTLCMTFAEMHACVEEAHNHRLKVTGHCRATEGIKNALRAGYDTLEHGTFMDGETLDMLLERDTPVVPALQFEHASIERGREFGMSQRVIDGHKETLEGGAKSARMILEAGGRLGMGGDYGFAWNAHGDYAKELTFFVRHVGFSPLETIVCATKSGAEIMGCGDEFGTLEAGKLADVLIVDGDVLADISILEDRSRFLAVLQGGVLRGATRQAHRVDERRKTPDGLAGSRSAPQHGTDARVHPDLPHEDIMRLATIQTAAGPRAAVLQGDAYVDLHATRPDLPLSVRELLAAGPAMLRAAAEAVVRPDAVRHTASSVQLRAPIPDPPKVICVGLNYRDHAAESGAPIPKEPVLFSKFATAIIGPEEAIRLPAVSREVDYEAELVLVVGKKGRRLSASAAMDHLAGYTVGHDVSARDWQLKKDGKQWLAGKTFDTFAPIGPVLVTADEIADPHNLAIRLRLNGKIMQDSSTRQMIFTAGDILSYVSQIVTLEPGDVIFTGTPPGVGFARKPPVFLKDGDRVEVEIEGLGVLRNPVVQEK
ncbi:MAG TPA: fumarylacetoacetate hydrolase family protein, partial [Gemmataceae bacterium]